MAVNQKRPKGKSPRIKQDPSVSKLTPDRNAVRSGHVICVTNVPSALCTSEQTVRELFAQYGTLLSVTIHHNFLDMEPTGFMFLEYSEKEEAAGAVAAVRDQCVENTPSCKVKFEKGEFSFDISGMKAVVALCRGEPHYQEDDEMKDILLGRQQGNRFTWSQPEPADEEELMLLQSLSQHSFMSSQPTRGKKKRRKDADAPKRAKKEVQR